MKLNYERIRQKLLYLEETCNYQGIYIFFLIDTLEHSLEIENFLLKPKLNFSEFF